MSDGSSVCSGVDEINLSNGHTSHDKNSVTRVESPNSIEEVNLVLNCKLDPDSSASELLRSIQRTREHDGLVQEDELLAHSDVQSGSVSEQGREAGSDSDVSCPISGGNEEGAQRRNSVTADSECSTRYANIREMIDDSNARISHARLVEYIRSRGYVRSNLACYLACSLEYPDPRSEFFDQLRYIGMTIDEFIDFHIDNELLVPASGQSWAYNSLGYIHEFMDYARYVLLPTRNIILHTCPELWTSDCTMLFWTTLAQMMNRVSYVERDVVNNELVVIKFIECMTASADVTAEKSALVLERCKHLAAVLNECAPIYHKSNR